MDICHTKGNADIISTGLGDGGPSTTTEAEIDDMYTDSVPYISAAVNDGVTSNSYMASYKNVISAAATNSNNDTASFSERNTQVELAATGVDVISTVSYIYTRLETFTVGNISQEGSPLKYSGSTNIPDDLFT